MSPDAKLASATASGVQIEHVPLTTLRPNPKNPRTHSRNQRRRLKALIAKFGFINPIIADEHGVILAGHGRFAAASELGLTSVPVVRLTHLSAAEKRAYLLADNKIAEDAGWDRNLLAIELGELSLLLPAQNLDLELTGFAVGEIDVLLQDMSDPPLTPEDQFPIASVVAVSRRGDLWRLGPHRILCEDAQLSQSYERLTNGDFAAMGLCDPPYNLQISSIVGRGSAKHEEFAFGSGEMTDVAFRDFLQTSLQFGIRHSAEGSVHFVFMDWRHIDALITTARQLYTAYLNLVVWNKTNAGQGSFYRSQHELIGVFRHGGSAHRNNIELGKFGRNRPNVWTYPGVNSFGSGRQDALNSHPTVKPVALVADAIKDCTTRGDIVLDQFLGSGTTLIAAEKTGRVAYGLEYEPRYVDVAIRRWQIMTKRDAVLDGDGRSFEEILSARRSASSSDNNSRVGA